MKRFHFDVGNSSSGPIGMCGIVKAETKEAAVEIVRACLVAEFAVPTYDAPDAERIVYWNVYLNPDKITVKHVDDEDEYEEKDDADE